MRTLPCIVVLAAAACGAYPSTPGPAAPGGGPPAVVRYEVSYDPYHGLSWPSAIRCKTQLHDHVQTEEARLRAYDRAGYCAVSAMHYSGVPWLELAWSERHWPVTRFLEGYGSDEELLASFDHLRLLLPGAEEAGFDHVLSPFLLEYVEALAPDAHRRPRPWQYRDTQQCIDRVTERGGLAFVAHPWYEPERYLALEGFTGVEIYSAYAAYRHRYEDWAEDRNPRMVETWDRMLGERSSRIWAIAVNDHRGPFQEERHEKPEVYDSGKIVVLLEDVSLPALRDALERGAFYAVADLCAEKDRFPEVRSVTVTEDEIRVATTGEVTWIAGGSPVARGPSFALDGLPPGLGYVRAEVSNECSKVYLQPFSLSPWADPRR